MLQNANRTHHPDSRGTRAKPSKDNDPIIRRLRAIENESPDLKEAARFYEAILPLLRDADLHAGTISLTPDQVRDKMASGVPLLFDVDLDLDGEAMRMLMIMIAAAVEKTCRHHQPFPLRLPWFSSSREPDREMSRIRRALEENKLETGALLSHLTAGTKDGIASVAKGLDLDPDRVRTLMDIALKPALRAWCRQLAPLAGELSWSKGSCFVCGNSAALAELQGNNLSKHLRCGQCGADWHFPRMQCLYCGNDDHRSLKHLSPEGRYETNRVEVCDKCHGYLKVITSFAPSSPEMLTVLDLATLPLDIIADERGYTRGDDARGKIRQTFGQDFHRGAFDQRA